VLRPLLLPLLLLVGQLGARWRPPSARPAKQR
jgi:hypothetical protein